jgi:hypothetical protein
LAFGKLKQYVPEFNAFLLKNGTGFDGLNAKEGAEFFGARLVGRWKSGKFREELLNLSCHL